MGSASCGSHHLHQKCGWFGPRFRVQLAGHSLQWDLFGSPEPAQMKRKLSVQAPARSSMADIRLNFPPTTDSPVSGATLQNSLHTALSLLLSRQQDEPLQHDGSVMWYEAICGYWACEPTCRCRWGDSRTPLCPQIFVDSYLAQKVACSDLSSYGTL